MEFDLKQWKKIKYLCKKNNLIFLSSPFSNKAVDVLRKIQVPAWKIGSGEFFSNQMLNKIFKFKQPIILSTGLSTIKEIKDKIKIIRKQKCQFILMQCTSLYPCSFDKIGVNLIKEFKKKFNCLVGLSDHSGSIYPSIYAMINGASIVEVHVGDKKNKKNPDHSSSISFKDLEELVRARDIIFQLKDNPVKKVKLDTKLVKIKKIFTKSCALKKPKNKGEILTKEDIIFKKPGTGIKENQIKKIIGKKFSKNVSNDRLLRLGDFK